MKNPNAIKLALLASLLIACGDDPEPEPPKEVWGAEVDGVDPAFLAVAPLGGAGSDLIAVGGPFVGDGPPAIYRRAADATWAPTTPPAGWVAAAWWAWAASPQDVWVVGEDLQVARGAIGNLAMTPIPMVDGSTKATLFGVWGSGPNDVWMVGGSTRDRSGPQGIVLRWNGQSIEKLELTGTASTAAGETLFKVWGSGPNDVMITGANGVAIHYDGQRFERVTTNTRARLLTVHGRSEFEMYAVGGAANGVALQWDGFAWRNIAPPDAPPLNGVFAADDGRVYVCGVTGYVAYYDGTKWTEVFTEVFGRDFHGVFARAGSAFFAGGRLAVEPGSRQGIVGRFGL